MNKKKEADLIINFLYYSGVEDGARTHGLQIHNLTL
jgi:hypothetical protein